MSSGFWSGYRKSLKSLDVEEPIDVWVHRPLAYLLARAVFFTPVSPNAITVISLLLGVAALVFILLGNLPLAGLLVFLSAIFDCADGQLARMRGTSSAFGRMLDGISDLVVTVAAVGGGTYLVWTKFSDPWPLGIGMLVGCAATATTGSFHTSMYDHYKNLFLHMTRGGSGGEEDLSSAQMRYEAEKAGRSLPMNFAWFVYLFYLRSQLDFAKWFDPHLGVESGAMPPYDEDRARCYREASLRPMRLWRYFFGFGSLVFGLAVSITFNIVEWYLLVRLVVLNGIFFFYLRPMQQQASKYLISALGMTKAA